MFRPPIHYSQYQESTLKPKHWKWFDFADDIFKSIFLNVNYRTWIQISLKFVHTGPSGIKSSMVQIMPKRRSDKPKPEEMTTPVYRRIYA